jgi:hypothetical protein
MKSLQQRLIDAGIEIDHHATDLYFPVTEESSRILREYRSESAVVHMVTTFKSNIDGMLWYDVPFMFEKKIINNESLWGTK